MSYGRTLVLAISPSGRLAISPSLTHSSQLMARFDNPMPGCFDTRACRMDNREGALKTNERVSPSYSCGAGTRRTQEEFAMTRPGTRDADDLMRDVAQRRVT